MKFSILIPTFNRVNYLKDAVLSVINQRHVDFEVVVIDNASTDGLSAFLDSMLCSKEWNFKLFSIHEKYRFISFL